MLPPRMATAPNIQLPGQGPQQSPAISNAVHSSSGYTTNHSSYNMTRQLLASNVYTSHGGHVIIVEVRAVHMPIGKTKAQLIGVSFKSEKERIIANHIHQDVLQAVDDVPVHIGAVDLKNLLYSQILPVWLAYTEQFPLDIEEIMMRTKDWVEIHPLNPDRDVIARQFRRTGKNGGITFKTGRCLINFHIPNKIYNQYLNYAERKDEERLNNIV